MTLIFETARRLPPLYFEVTVPQVCERDKRTLVSFPRDFIEDRLLSLEDIFSGEAKALPHSPERDMEMVDDNGMFPPPHVAAAAPGLGPGSFHVSQQQLEMNLQNLYSIDHTENMAKMILHSETLAQQRCFMTNCDMIMVMGYFYCLLCYVSVLWIQRSLTWIASGQQGNKQSAVPSMAAVATLDSQSSMFRVGRNIFTHMTLEQRPESFEVLVQRYQGTGQCQDGKQEVVASGDTFGCKLRDATPVDLVANTSLCSLENVDIQSKGDSNSDANLLLLQMVDSKAWSSRVTRVRSSGQHKFWIPESGSDPACVQLRNEGLIIPSGPEPDHFVISTKGAKALEMKLQVGSTMSLEDYHKQSGCVNIQRIFHLGPGPFGFLLALFDTGCKFC